VVSQAQIRVSLGTDRDTYTAVLINRKACANGALLCQRVLDVLLARHKGRFSYFDGTMVDRLTLDGDAARLEAGGGVVSAERVVLCTNGYRHLGVENRAGPVIEPELESVVGYMAAFTGAPGRPAGATSYILNDEIGGALPYYYLTHRPYTVAGRAVTLTCLGGPEAPIEDTDAYDLEGDMPLAVLHEFDGQVRSACFPSRAPGLPYDCTWHGLMGYTAGKIRRVGFEPRNPMLLYNLGCNGVGFLPSIAGGRRIARLLSGERLPPSLFDPV
jgi:glycine/D-amino acid oxidase-like deaminating enzyme